MAAGIISTVFRVINLLILVRIIMSFIPMDYRGNSIVRAIYDLTEPIMAPFRRIIPPIGMIDISPIVLFLVLQFLESILLRLVR